MAALLCMNPDGCSYVYANCKVSMHALCKQHYHTGQVLDDQTELFQLRGVYGCVSAQEQG